MGVCLMENFSLRITYFLMTWGMAVCCAGQAKQAIAAQDDRQVAIQQVLDQMPQCQGLGDYYWEIGDGQGVLVQGQHGRTLGPNDYLGIASASKWVFAAYVVQRLGSGLAPEQIEKLQLTSGYDRLNPAFCIGKPSAEACFEAANNSRFDATHVGLFSYNGGHMQKLMMDLGLGNLGSEALTTDLHRYLPLDAAFSYNSPQAAGGLRATPAAYGDFLRRIIRGELTMADYLGRYPVCTAPGSCPAAVSSPVPFAWHYSLGHWVEDDPLRGDDGAFSSAGAFGFYPWISADRRFYGLLARNNFQPSAAVESVACGIAIRHAFMD
jgi:hypothetical protein